MKNHIFTVRSIIQDIKNTKNSSVDLQFLDMKQCFDSLDLKEVLIELYESGVKNELINVIYEANKRSNVAVKTSVGTTTCIEIGETWMQGDVLASIGCSNLVENFSKEIAKDSDTVYKYKNTIEIPPILGFIDNILGIQKCGNEAKSFNKIIN